MTLPDPPILWLIAGALLLALEAFGAPGIGFLFAGLGAITAAVMGHFAVAETLWSQTAWFFGATTFWGILLWKPIKRFNMSRGGGQSFSNMVGGEAVVLAPGLKKDQTGKVRWSGTIMEARLDGAATAEEVAADGIVIIREVKGNMLVVAPAQ